MLDTSRAGQAGGGSFQKKTPISQRKNLPIECAQGDRPARCPFHAHDPRVWVDARHQITATVPNHRTVRAATKRHLQSMRQQHATGRPQRQAWHANQTQMTLQGTTRCYYKVLQVLHSSTSTTKYYSSTTKYYSSTSLYYKVLLKYYSVLLQYYSVLQSTTPVLLWTTKCYKVLLQYYSVWQLTTPVLLCTTEYCNVLPHHIWNVIYIARSNKSQPPTSPNTAPATKNGSHDWCPSHMKRHLQCAEQQASPSNLTKYCACHVTWLSWLILVTYETSFTMRGATGITLQPHQILCLPRKMMRIIGCRDIWNIIYNARSNRHHPPTSPNTVPATKNDAHHRLSWQLKRHLQCAEQQASPSNLTKYCACHEKWCASLILVTYETSFTMRGATSITLQPHQILHLPRKMTLMIDVRHIWNVIYNARSNKHHPPTSPNTAPATQNCIPKS